MLFRSLSTDTPTSMPTSLPTAVLTETPTAVPTEIPTALLRIECYIAYEEDKENEVLNEVLNERNIIDSYVLLSKKFIHEIDGCKTFFEGVYEIQNNLVVVNNELVEISSLYNMKKEEINAKEKLLYNEWKNSVLNEIKNLLKKTESLEKKLLEKDLLANRSYLSYFIDNIFKYYKKDLI